MGGSGIDPFGPTPNAYLTKEGKVRPAHPEDDPLTSALRDGLEVVERMFAAAPRVINEKWEELVAERDGLVERLADRTRERDEAQLEVERLNEKIKEMKDDQRRAAGFFTDDEIKARRRR